MRKVLWLIVIGCVAAQATLAGAAARPQRTIPCDEIIGTTAFPYLGSSAKQHQYRLVLDAVSAPPAYLRQTSPTGETPWRYFSKRGMVVKSGESATVMVPAAWERRVGIVWGNGGHGVFHTLRIAACGSDPNQGHAYAGGFYLRARAACVPLVFGVGSRRQTVWFGVGRRCR